MQLMYSEDLCVIGLQYLEYEVDMTGAWLEWQPFHHDRSDGCIRKYYFQLVQPENEEWRMLRI